MDGRSHLAAGALAGATVAAVAFQGGWADTWAEAATLGGLCAGFAQFPDLDTASRPQRWAARALVVALGWLAAEGLWRAAALLGLAGLLPLLTHHRGWTHRWWAVPLVPLAALGFWHLLMGGGVGWAVSSPAAAGRWMARGAVDWGPAYLAMAGGYALHLTLDRIRPGR